MRALRDFDKSPLWLYTWHSGFYLKRKHFPDNFVVVGFCVVDSFYDMILINHGESNVISAPSQATQHLPDATVVETMQIDCD